MTNNVRWVHNISKGPVYRQTDTVQSHAETLEHPYIGQGDLVFCAQCSFHIKTRKRQLNVSDHSSFCNILFPAIFTFFVRRKQAFMFV